MNEGQKTGGGGQETGAGRMEHFGGLRKLWTVSVGTAFLAPGGLALAGLLWISAPSDPQISTALRRFVWAAVAGFAFGGGAAVLTWMLDVGEAMLDLEEHQRHVRGIVDEQYHAAAPARPVDHAAPAEPSQQRAEQEIY